MMKATHITGKSCSVLTQIDGRMPYRKAYENSEQGRVTFLSECAECENLDEVLEAWGDTPTVVHTPDDTEPETQLSNSERIEALKAQLAAYEAAYTEGVSEGWA